MQVYGVVLTDIVEKLDSMERGLSKKDSSPAKWRVFLFVRAMVLIPLRVYRASRGF